MTKIEKINRYIELTGVKYEDSPAYELWMKDAKELANFAKKDCLSAIGLAFDYGRAKGERHARKELKKA